MWKSASTPILVVLSNQCYTAYCIRRCHTSAPPSLAVPGMTGIAHSNALDCHPSAIALLTVPLLGFFQNGLCLACVDLLIWACDCRLVEWEADRSAGHPVAGSSERRPAEDRHSTLQQPQPGLKANVQAQPQVQSQSCVQLTSLNAFMLHLQGSTCAS